MTDSNRRLAYVALLVNTLIWGAALPIVKPALSLVSPYQYLFYRYLLGAILILPFLLVLLAKYRPSFKQLAAIALLETFVLVFGHSLLYYGLSLTTSLEASLIGITSPVFITLGGIFLLKEHEERHEAIGLILALVGTLVITLEPFGGSGPSTPTSFTGNLFVLSYVLTWTIYNLIAKKLYPRLPKLMITAVGLWVGTLGMGLVVLATEPALTGLSSLATLTAAHLSLPTVLYAALYMGILGTIVAVPTYTFGLSVIEASEASIFSYLQPLISIPLAVLWLREPFQPSAIIGLAFIGVGVFWASRRSPKPRPASN